MLKITVKVDGMMCGMCESHINDAIRSACEVKKVTSSHTKGETVILTERDPGEEKLREIIGKTGYEFVSMEKEPYEKKSVLPWKK
jgi:copper chaperone CopZ